MFSVKNGGILILRRRTEKEEKTMPEPQRSPESERMRNLGKTYSAQGDEKGRKMCVNAFHGREKGMVHKVVKETTPGPERDAGLQKVGERCKEFESGKESDSPIKVVEEDN